MNDRLGPIARALKAYEAKCGTLAEQAVEMHRSFPDVSLVLIRRPSRSSAKNEGMFVTLENQTPDDATVILHLKRGMSAEVMAVEMAAAAKTHPVLDLDR